MRESPFAALRRFARPPAPEERCELCGLPLASGHAHLLDLETRSLACACEACAILFAAPGAGRYRRVPRRVRYWPELPVGEGEWESLRLPIGLAFLYRRGQSGKVVAAYPGPAGATESLLDLGESAGAIPALAGLEPDVEALLVNRLGRTREAYLVPIDECYRLAGIIRSNWRGLSGGAKMWDEVGRFFENLKERSCRT